MKEAHLTMYSIGDTYRINNTDGSALIISRRNEDGVTRIEFYEDEKDIDYSFEGDVNIYLNEFELETIIKSLQSMKKQVLIPIYTNNEINHE